MAKLEIVEHLRKAHGVHGEVADFRVDPDQCSVSFKAPGYTADAFIDRATGSYDLTVTRMGLVAIVNDLHKGRDSGPAWKLLIDLSAALLTFVSLSGLVLIYFIHKHRFAGLMSLAGRRHDRLSRLRGVGAVDPRQADVIVRSVLPGGPVLDGRAVAHHSAACFARPRLDVSGGEQPRELRGARAADPRASSPGRRG